MTPDTLSGWHATPHFFLRVSSWFDGETLHAEPALIEIDQGRIVRIESGTTAGVLPLLDATGFSAAPQLADTHVHCYLSAWPIDPDQRKTPGEKPFAEEVADGITRVQEMAGAGIGAARDMGDPKLYNNAIRARLPDAAPGFTLQSGGQGMFMPGRYGRFLGIATEPVDLEKEVDRLAETEQVDFIKLIPTGIINFSKGAVTSAPSYSVEQIQAVVARAHRHGLKVAAHCSGEAGLDRCIDGRVDFIEHAYFATRQHLERMRDAGLCWTPTLIPVHVQWAHAELCGWDAKTKSNLRRILDEHYQRLTIAKEIQLTVLSGSDAGGAGVGHGGGLIQEVELLARIFSPAEAHAIATGRSHAALGLKDEGRLAPGAQAKLVLYRQAPAEDIRHLRQPQWILTGSQLTRGGTVRTADHPDVLQFGLAGAEQPPQAVHDGKQSEILNASTTTSHH